VSVPPKWVRRPIAYLALYLLLLVTILASPVLVVVAMIASYWLPGHWRALRLFGFAMTALLLEAAAVLTAGVLWVASGFGVALHTRRWQDGHYAVLRWFLRVLVGSARRLFRLRVTIDAPGAERRGSSNPVLVLSRHAGPGDSLLVVHTLMSEFGRRPRVVLKNTMQLDPTCDLYLNRLPAKFVDPNPGEGENMTEGIAALARDMGEDDALLIFPEGGNFTPKRRTRAIRRLRKSGHTEAAEMAETLKHLLPPRPAGVHAALDAAPETDVVLVAHTGLDTMITVADVWSEIPEAKLLHARWEVNLAGEVPKSRDAQVAWLNEHWLDIDAWIEATNE
jgi:1-acyl-sn-glycerol-3-phosphate acyltransferase